MSRRDLVVVCCGDASLHDAWIVPDRSYDVFTIYYGDDPAKKDHYARLGDRFYAEKGLKIELARKVLLHRLMFEETFDFAAYGHVWFPDDDLAFPGGAADVEALFAAARDLAADVFQPAVANENYSRLWEATRVVPDVFAHRTNIVEIMAHGFSGAAFQSWYLPAIHALDYMKCGWGVEPIWTKIGEAAERRALRTFVIDAVPVIHTRPVGSGHSRIHRVGNYEAGFLPQIATNRMQTLAVVKDRSEIDFAATPPVVDGEAIEAHHAERFARFGETPWGRFARVLGRGIAAIRRR